jgi:hypothetical protein
MQVRSREGRWLVLDVGVRRGLPEVVTFGQEAKERRRCSNEMVEAKAP